MKLWLAAFLTFVAVVQPARAVDELPPLGIINQEGELVVSDGSSYYDFRKDGRFISGPIDGISGRVIDGTWTIQGDKNARSLCVDLVVKGTWSWVNGVSALNDRRTMVMAVYALDPKFETYPKQIGIYGMEEKTFKVRHGYFIIESMEKNTDQAVTPKSVLATPGNAATNR
jgi:hypothetical protein